MAQKTMVALKCDAIGCTERLFDFQHAERLLTMKDNGGWVLATEDYELKDGNLVRRHKEEDSEGKQKRRNK